MEEFKKIIGYHKYEASNLGNIKSLPRKGTGGHNGKILKPFKNKRGYDLIDLMNNGKRKGFLFID